MQITDPFNNPRLFIEQTKADTLNQLRSGQVVTAQVIKPAANGVAQIDIGGIKLPVQTGVKLEIGQQLTLNVVKGGKAPELQLVRNLPPDAIQSLALKRILPQQQPIQQLLEALKSLSTATPAASTQLNGATPQKTDLMTTLVRELFQLSGKTGTLPSTHSGAASNQTERNIQILTAALQSAAKPTSNANNLSQVGQQITQLVEQAVSGNRPLSADTIKQAFGQSGLFLESRINSSNSVGTDFKASLLKLIEALQPLTVANPAMVDSAQLKATDTATTLQMLAARIFSELQQLSEGSLARIQLHQLASLPQEESNLRQVWQFELPIPHPEGHDDFHIRFEKEVNQQDPSDIRWSVILNFDIPPAGPITAKLNLVGDVISSHFTAESSESVRRVEAALPELSAAFEKAGLIVGRLSTRQGISVRQHDLPAPPFPLLDEKA